MNSTTGSGLAQAQTRAALAAIAARSSKADDLAAIYADALDAHRADAKAAQIACDRFRQSARQCAVLAEEVKGELSWLATELFEMERAALLRVTERMLAKGKR